MTKNLFSAAAGRFEMFLPQPCDTAQQTQAIPAQDHEAWSVEPGLMAFHSGGLMPAAGLMQASFTPGGTGRSLTHTSGSDLIDDAEEFNITLDFFGSPEGWDAALLDGFIAAADFLSTIITGDVADFVPRRGGAIDDLRIKASLVDIDGTGGVLGQAGPTMLRSDSALPVMGVMEFDRADAANSEAAGVWDEIVLHEMIHVLGFGTIWDNLGLLDTYTDDNGTPYRRNDDSLDYRFNGAAANAAFAAAFPDLHAESQGLGIFVETDGGAGTAGGHWDEETFDGELMTGYINDSGNYLSDMTIASLEDLGYETIWDSGTLA